MDKIYLRDLSICCIIGVYPQERLVPRELVLNVELVCSGMEQAALTDNFTAVMDYGLLTERIVEELGGSDYQLLESVAARVAELALEHPLVREAKVTVDKPGALAQVGSVAVEIVRGR